MPDSTYTLHIERDDGELVVMDGLDLVRGFIAGDPSAQHGGYDLCATRAGRRSAEPVDATPAAGAPL